MLSIAAGVVSRSSWAADIKPLLASRPVTASCTSVVLWMTPELVSQPSFLTTSGPDVALSFPALLTPTPASVPIREILPAYMPPKLEASSANCGRGPVARMGCVPAVGSLVRGSTSIRFAPVMTDNWFAQMLALSCTARAKILVKSTLRVSSPCPLMEILPLCTRYPSKPPLLMTGVPVVRVMRLALMKPPPSTLMPAGFAMTTSARAPATSMYPRSWLGSLELTSFKIMRAVPVAIQGLP